ncbi:MAG: hypothetical protein KTR26_00650 [Flammeovirgaceae bacterium]|nr:hypothetical protein [Flammeovirgaceae bacterium]
MKKLFGNKILNYLIEFIFIFSSVYFAFWLTNQEAVRKIKIIEEKAIKALHQELNENLNELQTSIQFHENVRNQLFIYNDSINENLVNAESLHAYNHLRKIFTRNSNSIGLPDIKKNAWEMLKSSEAYVYVDYELASELGLLYIIQEGGVEATSKQIVSDVFNSLSIYQKEKSEEVLLLTAYMFRELAGQEEFLIFKIKENIEGLENYYDYLK